MTTLPLSGDIAPLANGVRRGQLKRMSSDFSHYGCLTVTLWLTSGEGFRLSPSIHHLVDGIEVGTLRIELVLHPLADEPSVDVPWTFRNGGSISKLVIEQSGTRTESGILLHSTKGDEIIIVPAAFPHRLYVEAVNLPPQQVMPEYSLSRYLHETV